MARLELSVQFTCNEDHGRYLFQFPCGVRLQLPQEDVERSLPLRDMIEGAATSGETTIPFLSSVELSHFHNWAAAVQPDSPALQADAEGINRALEAADYLADEGLLQKLAVAYDAQLFPIDVFAADADFLRVLEGMREELASTVLATSSRPVGERAWRLPERLHPLDEAITAATTAAKVQRSSSKGQKETENLGEGSLRQVSVSPDGKLFATCSRCFSAGTVWCYPIQLHTTQYARQWSGHIAVWHTATFKLVRTLLGHAAQMDVSCHAWSPDSSLLATGCRDGTVAVWNVATGAKRASLDCSIPGGSFWDRAVTSVAWSPGGRELCTCSHKSAKVWNMITGTLMHTLKDRREEFISVAWSPDGARALTRILSGPVDVRDIATGDRACELEARNPTNHIENVAWSYNGGVIAALCDDTSVRVWDIATCPAGIQQHSFFCGVDCSYCIAWSPDGRHIATSKHRHKHGFPVLVWEVATGTVVYQIDEVDRVGMTSLAWSPCGNLLFASTNKAVHVYNVSRWHQGTEAN